jgi:hypothetical protein
LNSLDQLRDSLSDVENECLKIRARIQLGDLLWARDEARARQAFEEAFSLAFNSGSQGSKEGCAAQSRNELGFDVLKSIARRDAEWAAQLIESLPDAQSSGGRLAALHGARRPDLKTSLYQRLATSLQGSNSEKAKSAVSLVESRIGNVDSARLIRGAIFGGLADENAGVWNPATSAGEATPLSLLGAQWGVSGQNFASPQFEMTQALFRGDFNQASSLIEKISDPQTRLQFGSIASFSEVSASISAGNFDEALRLAQSLPEVSQRATAFVTLAQALRGRKGAIKAIEILLVARQSLNAEEESAEKAQAMLTLAEAITELEPDRGFEFAQAAIETFNSTDSKNESAPGEAGYEEPELGQVLTRLSRCDFARAWNLALGINNHQRAWFTKLAVCRGSLDEEPAVEKATQN